MCISNLKNQLGFSRINNCHRYTSRPIKHSLNLYILSRQMHLLMLLGTASVMLSHWSGVPAISVANGLTGADPPTTCIQMDKQPPRALVLARLCKSFIAANTVLKNSAMLRTPARHHLVVSRSHTAEMRRLIQGDSALQTPDSSAYSPTCTCLPSSPPLLATLFY